MQSKSLLRFRFLNELNKNICILLAGSIFTQIITLCASPILTRLFSPSDYGIFAIYSVALSVLTVIGSFRYELALLLPREEEEAVNLLVLSEVVVVLMSFLAIPVILLLINIFSYPLGNLDIIKPYLWILPVSLFLAGSYQILVSWMLRKKIYFPLTAAKLNQSILGTLALLVFGVWKLKGWGLVVGDVIASASAAATLSYFFFKSSGRLFVFTNVNTVFQMGVRYKRFPFFSSLSGFVNICGLQAFILLFGFLYGLEKAGWFLLCQKISRFLLVAIGEPVSQAFLSESAQACRRGESVKDLYFKFLKRLFIAGVVPALALGFLGGKIFSLFFGSAWMEAGWYAQILSYMFLTEFVVSPLSNVLLVHEKLIWQLAWDVGRIFVVTGLFLCACLLNWDARTTIFSYGICLSLSYMVLFGMHIQILRRDV